MRKLHNLLTFIIVSVLAVGPTHVTAEIPKNETPVQTVNDEHGNKIEKIEVIELSDAEAKKEGTYNAALKITFKRREQDARRQFRKSAKNLYKINTKQKSGDGQREEIVMRFSRTAADQLEKFSPENVWNKRFIDHIQANAQYESIKRNNSFRSVSIRFPLETVAFYAVIGANACMFSMAHLLTSGARTNLTCLDTFTNSFKDPISNLSFASFVATSAVTQLGGNRFLKYIDGKALGVRESALIKQHSNLVSGKLENSAVARLESTVAAQVNPTLSKVPKLAGLLGPTGMAMGMLASRIFEESLRDENIQMCAKGIYQNALKKEPSEKEINLPKEFSTHCQTAWDNWMKGDRWAHYGIDMIGLISASYLSHGLLSGFTYGLKQMSNGVAQGIANVLTYQFTFSGSGQLKNVSPQFDSLKTALSPLLPSSLVNLSGFMTVDHSIISKITSGVKIAQQKDRLRITKYKDIDPEVKRLLSDVSNEKSPVDKEFDRVFREYSSDLAVYRQMKMGTVSAPVTDWMNKTNEFLGVYQAAHQFYRDFFWSDATARAESTTEINPFDSRDYLRKVNSWLDRGQFAEDPIGLVVDSIDQTIDAGAQIPLSVALKGMGYNGNEIANFPLYSKLLTISKTAEEIRDYMIGDLEKSPTAGRTKKDQAETLRLLKVLAQNPTNWEDLVKSLQPRLNIEQKEILDIYLGLRAGDYNLTPDQVLSRDDMKALKLEENYRVKFNGPKNDIIQGFEEPSDRDIVKLITRADKRSVKELEFRMKRAEHAVKKLDLAQKKFKDSAILNSATNRVGEPSEAAPAGTKYLTELMKDKDRFSPDLFSYIPKSLSYVFGLRPVDFMMISMACGPSSYLLKPTPANPSLSDLINSPVVKSPVGSALVFRPPSVVAIDNKYLRNEICETQISAQSLYEKEFKYSGKTYKGLISLIRANTRQEFRGVEADERGIPTETLRFDTWWNSHIKPIAAGILENLQTEYYNMVINDIVPAWKQQKIFDDLRSDTDFNVSLIRQLSEANIELEKKDARKTNYWFAGWAAEKIDLELYRRLDILKTKMWSIEDFLVKAANSNKIFPPPNTDKADISYLANSNAEYLKMREDILKDIIVVGEVLKIDLNFNPMQEVEIRKGSKFATEGSEGHRIAETALRNLINNINELHRYSDMIYILTKKISE